MEPAVNKSIEDKLKILLEWKKKYLEALVDQLNPTGNVLEIGFGLGFAADRIKSFNPKSHTIIESDPQAYKEAVKWAAKNNANVIQGPWESALPNLGKFDAILFNDYPVENDIEIMNFLFPEEALTISTQVRDLLSVIEEQMSQLTIQFTDQDIEAFYQKVGQFNKPELPKFFQKLKGYGNITKSQYENVLKKYQLEELNERKSKDLPAPSPKKQDKMSRFIEIGLNHLANGGRFTSFLNSQNSKYEDSHFFENVITNTNFEYKEDSLPIKMSDHTREALVPLIENKS